MRPLSAASTRLTLPVGPRSRARSDRPWRWRDVALLGGVALAGYLWLDSMHLRTPSAGQSAPVAVPAVVAQASTEVPATPPNPAPPVPVKPAVPPPAAGLEPAKRAKKEAANRASMDAFFANQGPIPTFIIKFEPAEWEYLKRDSRRYAEASLWEEGNRNEWKGVAVRCKGSAGSFQQPDQRPGLSISMSKYKGAERWHGFLKWHLNNGAQDASLLNEQISCEMARLAGVPASRCFHAFLNLQGRDLGHYLFKEAFDEDFLVKFYPNSDGDLYDGGFVHEVDLSMEKDLGDPNHRENLQELIGACQEGDPVKRKARLEKILDIDKFLSFIAIESITCHWDGYNFNKNNYRLYFDSTTGRASFFLHGTDQTFNDPNGPATREPVTLVGKAVMTVPEWNKAYAERVRKIYDEVLKPIDWGARVTEIGEKVKAAMALKNPAMAKEYQAQIDGARARVTARIAAVGKQMGDAPKLFKFDATGVAVLKNEGWRTEGSAAALDTADRDGKPCLHLRAEGETSASWRRTLSLDPGKYRLEVRVCTAGVVPSKSPAGEGAGLRISGGQREAQDSVSGDTAWKEVSFPFTSTGGEVVVVAELRASKGEVWFDRDSFRLREVK